MGPFQGTFQKTPIENVVLKTNTYLPPPKSPGGNTGSFTTSRSRKQRRITRRPHPRLYSQRHRPWLARWWHWRSRSPKRSPRRSRRPCWSRGWSAMSMSPPWTDSTSTSTCSKSCRTSIPRDWAGSGRRADWSRPRAARVGM